MSPACCILITRKRFVKLRACVIAIVCVKIWIIFVIYIVGVKTISIT